MKKLIALAVVVLMVASMFTVFADGNKATLDGTVVPTKDLDILTDGVFAEGATAFSDARLVGIQNKKFAEVPESKFSIVVELAEAVGITGIKIGAYKDRNSFVDLPKTVKISLSNDGVNYVTVQSKPSGANFALGEMADWKSTVEGVVDDTTREGGHKADATLTIDWKTRGNLVAKFVKVDFVLEDEWLFLSEIQAVTEKGTIAEAAPNKENVDTAIDEIALAGVDCEVPSAGAVVLTSEAGEISLTEGVEGDYKNVRGGNLTWAKWDDEANGYVVTKNECNPWPNNREGSLTVGEDEIVISTLSNGNIGYDFAGEKWIMRYIEVGTVLHIYEDSFTIGKTLAGEEQIHFGASEPIPDDPTTPVDPATGDAGMIALAVIAVFALGGAAVISKRK